MKKTILSFIFFILLCLTTVSNVLADNGSSDKGFDDKVELIHDGNSGYYKYLPDAINALKDNDTIKLLDSAVANWYATSDVTINKENITFDLNGKSMSGMTVHIKNSTNINIIANGGGMMTDSDHKKKPVLIVESGKATIDGGYYKDPVNQYNTFIPAIKVGAEGSNGASLVVKNNPIIDSSTVAIETNGTNSNLEIQSVELLQGQNYAIAIAGTNNNIDIKGGKSINASAGASISSHNGSKGTNINISGGNITSGVWVYGTSPSFIMTGGSIKAGSDYGIEVGGTNAKLNIKGGKIQGVLGGIFQYKDGTNTTIDISGEANIIGNNDFEGFASYGHAPAIFLQNTGNVTIGGGTLTGQFGIVTRVANVTINGGTINATGSNNSKITWDNHDISYKSGVSVLVDNASNSSLGKAKVTINGGEFNATAENTLLSYENNNTDFSVSGGIYNKPFKNEFVVPNKLELKVIKGDDAKWYVGQDAENIYKEIEGNNEYSIEIIKGEISKEPEQQEDPNKPDTEQNKTEKPEDNNETNPNTADNIIIFAVLLVASAIGIGSAVYYTKRKMNK